MHQLIFFDLAFIQYYQIFGIFDDFSLYCKISGNVYSSTINIEQKSDNNPTYFTNGHLNKKHIFQELPIGLTSELEHE